MYPRLSQGEWVYPKQVGHKLDTSWTPRWAVEHMTNEKRTPIMASFKKSKRYLSDSYSETESDFPRFIIIESLQDTKLDQLSRFLIEKNDIQKIQPKNCKETPNWKPACRSGKQKTRWKPIENGKIS